MSSRSANPETLGLNSRQERYDPKVQDSLSRMVAWAADVKVELEPIVANTPSQLADFDIEANGGWGGTLAD